MAPGSVTTCRAMTAKTNDGPVLRERRRERPTKEGALRCRRKYLRTWERQRFALRGHMLTASNKSGIIREVDLGTVARVVVQEMSIVLHRNDFPPLELRADTTTDALEWARHLDQTLPTKDLPAPPPDPPEPIDLALLTPFELAVLLGGEHQVKRLEDLVLSDSSSDDEDDVTRFLDDFNATLPPETTDQHKSGGHREEDHHDQQQQDPPQEARKSRTLTEETPTTEPPVAPTVLDFV